MNRAWLTCICAPQGVSLLGADPQGRFLIAPGIYYRVGCLISSELGVMGLKPASAASYFGIETDGHGRWELLHSGHNFDIILNGERLSRDDCPRELKDGDTIEPALTFPLTPLGLRFEFHLEGG